MDLGKEGLLYHPAFLHSHRTHRWRQKDRGKEPRETDRNGAKQNHGRRKFETE